MSSVALQQYKNLYFHILFYEIQVCFLFQRNEDNSNNKNHHYFFMLLLLIMLIIVFLHDSACHPSPLGIIVRITCFRRFECFEKIKTGYIFHFLHTKH